MPLPGHDHLLTTRNGDQPEWWNVIVIPVTSAAGLTSVENAKSYAAVKALENVSGSGIGVDGVGEVPTNAYLWFQTLPGGSSPTPGPTQTNCMSKLPSGSVVGAAALDDGTGYYETDAQGDVAAFGAATCYGALTGLQLNQPIVGMAVDRNTGGYWLVASDGGVFCLQRPVPRVDGRQGAEQAGRRDDGRPSTVTGYWLVASDGGVFSFDAPFQGSTGSLHLNKPVVGMGLDRATGGYWLVASDGGVFSFNAPFYGSAGGSRLTSRSSAWRRSPTAVAIASSPATGGCSPTTRPFYGSAGSLKLNKPVVAGVNNNSYDGYWLVASDGGVFTYSPTERGHAVLRISRLRATPLRPARRGQEQGRGDGPVGVHPLVASGGQSDRAVSAR